MKNLVVSAYQLFAYSAILLFLGLPKVAKRLIYSMYAGQVIYASNHGSRLDGQLISSSIPIRLFARSIPLAFMTKNVYLKHWWQKMFLYPLGLFPAFKEGDKKVGLSKAQEMIEKGYSMFVFPEGGIGLPGEKRPKKGAAILAKQNKLPIQPVNIYWHYNRRNKKKAIITFGAPYCLTGDYDYSDYSNFMMENIYSLSPKTLL